MRKLVLALVALAAYGQTSLNETTTAVASDAVAANIILTSAANVTASSYLYVIDATGEPGELMQVRSVRGSTVNVVRGAHGLTSANPHIAGARVIIFPNVGAFNTSSPVGACSVAQMTYTPVVNVVTGEIYECTGGAWARVDAGGGGGTGSLDLPCSVSIGSNQASVPTTCAYWYGVRAVSPGAVVVSATGTGNLYIVGEGSGIVAYGSGTVVPTCVSGSCTASPTVVTDWPDGSVRIGVVAVASGTLGTATGAEYIIGAQRVVAAAGGRITVTTLADGTQEIDASASSGAGWNFSMPSGGLTTGSSSVQGAFWYAGGSTGLSLTLAGAAPVAFAFTDAATSDIATYLPVNNLNTVKVRLFGYVAAGAATTGQVARMGIRTACTANGETQAAYNSEQTADFTLTTDGSNIRFYVATLSSLTLTGCAVGENIKISVRRLGTDGADTFPGSMYLYLTQVYE